jgi:hypothetical protein
MAKTLNASTSTELAKDSFNIINLLEFQGIGGASERLYITDAPVDISYSSNSYLSGRGMLGVSDIQEEEDLKIESVEITLSGVETANVKLFLDFDYIDRRVLIRRAIIGDDYNIIGDPILVFDGRLDQPKIIEDFKAGNATLGISATSHWADFEAIAGRHTNDSEHQVLHSGDTFFQKATETQKDVKWGRE